MKLYPICFTQGVVDAAASCTITLICGTFSEKPVHVSFVLFRGR